MAPGHPGLYRQGSHIRGTCPTCRGALGDLQIPTVLVCTPGHQIAGIECRGFYEVVVRRCSCYPTQQLLHKHHNLSQRSAVLHGLVSLDDLIQREGFDRKLERSVCQLLGELFQRRLEKVLRGAAKCREADGCWNHLWRIEIL